MADMRNRTPFYGTAPTTKLNSDHVFMADGSTLQKVFTITTDEEQYIGLLDGKPLYRKTIALTTPSTVSPTVILTMPEIDILNDISGMVGNSMPVNFTYGSGYVQTFFDDASKNVYMKTSYVDLPCRITLEYTKANTRSRKKKTPGFINDMLNEEG